MPCELVPRSNTDDADTSAECSAQVVNKQRNKPVCQPNLSDTVATGDSSESPKCTAGLRWIVAGRVGTTAASGGVLASSTCQNRKRKEKKTKFTTADETHGKPSYLC